MPDTTLLATRMCSPLVYRFYLVTLFCSAPCFMAIWREWVQTVLIFFYFSFDITTLSHFWLRLTVSKIFVF